MRKIIFFIISLFFVSQSFFIISYWYNEKLVQKSFLLKGVIEQEVKNGKLYIHAINVFIENISADTRKTNKLLTRVIELENKLKKKEGKTQKEKDIYRLLTYIRYQIFLTWWYRDSQNLLETEKEATISEDPKENKKSLEDSIIEDFNVSSEEFEQDFFNKRESKLDEFLEDIYSRDGIPDKEIGKKIREELKEIEFLYDRSSEKMRDQKRISDLKSIEKQLKNYYAKNHRYPEYRNILSDLEGEIPQDTFGGIIKHNCRFGYFYEVWWGNQEYRISSCLESESSLDLWQYDGGMDPYRYEIWTDISYAGKGISYIQNSDIYYFSLVDQKSDWGSVHGYNSWKTLAFEAKSNPTQKEIKLTLVSFRYQSQNPWVDKNNTTYHLINIIASALDNYFFEGDILALIEETPEYEWQNLSVGSPLVIGNNYLVGTIDYEKLWLKGDFPSDVFGGKMLLAYTDSGWGHYQILWFIREKKGGKDYKKVMIRGTYSPKNKLLKSWVDYILRNGNQIKFFDKESIYLFKSGEMINDTYHIMTKNKESQTLTLLDDITSLPKIILDQPIGLIFDPKTKKAYVDGDLLEMN